MEKMDPHLEPFNFSSVELAELALQNLHPYIEKCFIKEGKTLERPSEMYFPLDEKNVLVPAFHLHPLLLWPRDHSALPPITTDGPYFLEKAVPDFQEWDVITDCSKAALFELSRDAFLENAKIKPLTPPLSFRFTKPFLILGFYLSKLGLVLIGKKRFPLKKILSHFRYILKTRSIPFS